MEKLTCIAYKYFDNKIHLCLLLSYLTALPFFIIECGASNYLEYDFFIQTLFHCFIVVFVFHAFNFLLFISRNNYKFYLYCVYRIIPILFLLPFYYTLANLNAFITLYGIRDFDCILFLLPNIMSVTCFFCELINIDTQERKGFTSL